MKPEELIIQKLELLESELKDLGEPFCLASFYTSTAGRVSITVLKSGADMRFETFDEAFAYVDKRRSPLWRRFSL